MKKTRVQPSYWLLAIQCCPYHPTLPADWLTNRKAELLIHSGAPLTSSADWALKEQQQTEGISLLNLLSPPISMF